MLHLLFFLYIQFVLSDYYYSKMWKILIIRMCELGVSKLLTGNVCHWWGYIAAVYFYLGSFTDFILIVLLMHKDRGRLAIPEEGRVHGKTRRQCQQRLFQHTAWQRTALSTHPYTEVVWSASEKHNEYLSVLQKTPTSWISPWYVC